MTTETLTHFRTCPLCEATCGLEVGHRDGAVVRIRGDREDVFSHGFICPKGSTLGKLDQDPDRIRRPLIKRNGVHEEATWDEAFSLIEASLVPIISDCGPNSVGVYLGNPNVHSMSAILYIRPLVRMLRSQKIFTAATADQMPKHISSGYMFGHPDLIPVPDIDRTDYLLMLGANPLESNGSLATAPDWPGRMASIRARGGKVVVVDPRATASAKAADEHIPIRPGSDALLLCALANVIIADGLVAPGHLTNHIDGLEDLAIAVEGFTPESVAETCQIPAGTIRRLARDLATAERGVVYGRIGTHTVEFGTLSSWMVDVLNVITGHLDTPGGAMFPRPAHEQPRARRRFETGRWSTTVRGLPETRGELPVSTLAEEIVEAGDARIRAMITVAGNPVLSAPDSGRLDDALASLDFMVAVDIYLNETTRHADVILPGTSPLRRSHYDFAFYGLSVRNVANYSPPLFPLAPDDLDEWQILLRLAATVSGQGHDTDIDVLDDVVFATLVGSAVGNPASKIHGRDPEEIARSTDGVRGPERLLDFLIRTGPYGEGYGQDPAGLTLKLLRESPHGIDLGPLEPRLPEALCTPSGKVELAPPPVIADVERLRASLDRSTNGGLVLIGRRHVRSNNSWMHNIDVLVSGRDRCTLLINTADAARFGVEAGCSVKVTSSVGTLVASAEVTDDIMRGVVSLPHGWGHDRVGSSLSVASDHAGVNSNILSTGAMDPLSGNAVLNGIPVEVVPA